MPDTSRAGRYSASTCDRDMYRNRAAAPIVATVIEKMLSTALYWNTDRSGIAAPSKQKPSIIASPVF